MVVLLTQLTELNDSVGYCSWDEKNCVRLPDLKEEIKYNNVSGHFFAAYIPLPTYNIAYVKL